MRWEKEGGVRWEGSEVGKGRWSEVGRKEE